MASLDRTIVSHGSGIVSAIHVSRGRANVKTAGGATFTLDNKTRIFGGTHEAPVGSEVAPPGPGDAFVVLAALKLGDAVQFGANPYNYIPAVYQTAPRPVRSAPKASLD